MYKIHTLPFPHVLSFLFFPCGTCIFFLKGRHLHIDFNIIYVGSMLSKTEGLNLVIAAISSYAMPASMRSFHVLQIINYLLRSVFELILSNDVDREENEDGDRQRE